MVFGMPLPVHGHSIFQYVNMGIQDLWQNLNTHAETVQKQRQKTLESPKACTEGCEGVDQTWSLPCSTSSTRMRTFGRTDDRVVERWALDPGTAHVDLQETLRYLPVHPTVRVVLRRQLQLRQVRPRHRPRSRSLGCSLGWVGRCRGNIEVLVGRGPNLDTAKRRQRTPISTRSIEQRMSTTVTAHSYSTQSRYRHSTQSQHSQHEASSSGMSTTVTAHSYSTQSQHTVTAQSPPISTKHRAAGCRHSTQTQHTVTVQTQHTVTAQSARRIEQRDVDHAIRHTAVTASMDKRR